MLLLWCFYSSSTSHHLHEQMPDLECFLAARGVAGVGGKGGEWCGHPRRQSPRGGKVTILSKKKKIVILCA